MRGSFGLMYLGVAMVTSVSSLSCYVCVDPEGKNSANCQYGFQNGSIYQFECQSSPVTSFATPICYVSRTMNYMFVAQFARGCIDRTFCWSGCQRQSPGIVCMDCCDSDLCNTSNLGYTQPTNFVWLLSTVALTVVSWME